MLPNPDGEARWRQIREAQADLTDQLSWARATHQEQADKKADEEQTVRAPLRAILARDSIAEHIRSHLRKEA